MTRIASARSSPPRARSPSSRATPRALESTPSTSSSTHNATSSNVASPGSSSSDASPRGSKRPHAITSPSSHSPQPCYGYDKCPHDLKHPDQPHCDCGPGRVGDDELALACGERQDMKLAFLSADQSPEQESSLWPWNEEVAVHRFSDLRR